MKSIVFLMALMSLSISVSVRAGEGDSCKRIFAPEVQAMEIYNANTTRIRHNNQEAFYAEELDMSRNEFDQLLRDYQNRQKVEEQNRIRQQSIQARPATHRYNNVLKTAFVSEGKLSIEQSSPVSSKVFELNPKTPIENTNGSFEGDRGQYWVMPHNQGRLVIWDFAKEKVLDLKLPEKGSLVRFDVGYVEGTLRGKLSVEYTPHLEGVSVVENRFLEVDLVTGLEIKD